MTLNYNPEEKNSNNQVLLFPRLEFMDFWKFYRYKFFKKVQKSKKKFKNCFCPESFLGHLKKKYFLATTENFQHLKNIETDKKWNRFKAKKINMFESFLSPRSLDWPKLFLLVFKIFYKCRKIWQKQKIQAIKMSSTANKAGGHHWGYTFLGCHWFCNGRVYKQPREKETGTPPFKIS